MQCLGFVAGFAQRSGNGICVVDGFPKLATGVEVVVGIVADNECEFLGFGINIS